MFEKWNRFLSEALEKHKEAEKQQDRKHKKNGPKKKSEKK